VKDNYLGICHQLRGNNYRPEQHFKCRLMAYSVEKLGYEMNDFAPMISTQCE